jgi:hypothetical protein
MNPIYLYLFLAPLALALPGQQPAQARKLARIPAQETRPLQPPAAQAEDWKQKLGDSDLDRRESAYTELLERARKDDELRSTLEQWARSGESNELSWTARLALRELRMSGPARARGPGAAQRPGQDFDDLRRRFDSLEQHFGGMDSTFEDLRAQMDEMLRTLPQAPDGLQPAQPPAGAMQQFQGYSMQVGPDGVTLEMTEKGADGKAEKRTYKAKDMDELLQNYPELRGKIGGGEHFDLRGSPGQNWFFLRNGQPENDWLRSPRPSKQPPTDVLGIYSQKLAPEQARELELEPEQGLRVERVEPGTIAQILGIRRGDTIVELNGKAVYSAEDVRKVLKERKPDEDLSVTLIGEGAKERRTLRWSPSEPQPGNEKPRKL